MSIRFLALAISLFIASPAWGQIAATALTGAVDATDRSSAAPYVTASVSATANRLILLCTVGLESAGIEAPTISGLSATWVQIDEQDNIATANQNQTFLFRTMLGSNQTGTITISPAAGDTWVSAAWSVVEFSGVDTSGTDGSGAVVQTVKGRNDAADTTHSLTLAAFANSGNRPYMCAGSRIAGDQDFVSSDGADDLHDLNTGESQQLFTMWDEAVADTTPTFTWGTADQDVGAIAVEIGIAATGRRRAQPIIFQ